MNQYIFVFTFLLSLSLSYLLSKKSPKHLIDVPEKRKQHKKLTSKAGGIAIYVSLLSGILLMNNNDSFLIFLLVSQTSFFIVGLADDVYNFRSLPKFTYLFILSILTSVFYCSYFLSNTDILLIIVLSLWIFFNVNAFNVIDGMDGVCATLTMSSCLGLILFSYIENITLIFYLCSLLLFTILGFFIMNNPPAKIFLGDSGTHQIGIFLCLTSLYIFKTNNKGFGLYSYLKEDHVLFLVLILFVSYPAFDAIYTTILRYYNNVTPWHGDKNHPYHKLLKIGYGNYQVLLLINILNTIGIIFAFLLYYNNDYLILLLPIIGLILIVFINYLRAIPFESV